MAGRGAGELHLGDPVAPVRPVPRAAHIEGDMDLVEEVVELVDGIVERPV